MSIRQQENKIGFIHPDQSAIFDMRSGIIFESRNAQSVMLIMNEGAENGEWITQMTNRQALKVANNRRYAIVGPSIQSTIHRRVEDQLRSLPT